VIDNHGATSTEPVTIVVNGANDSPSAVPDSNGVAKGSVLSVTASAGVLSNDSDPDTHDRLVASAVNGSAAIVAELGSCGQLGSV
jgi:hypothetical protein